MDSDTATAPPVVRSLGGDFHKVLVASASSNLADGIFQVALPIIAARISSSPLEVAGVAIVGRLPWLLFVLVAGALADRLDRRRTMRNVQVVRVVIVGVLAALALTDQLGMPALYVAAFALGVGETLFDTAAQSILPSIVRPDQLSQANGRLYAAEVVMNSFIGPPLGGVLVGISIPLALGGSALGFALAAVGLALIAGSFRPVREGPPTRIVQDIREGLRFLMGHRLLRTFAFMVGVMNLAGAAVWAVFVLYALAPGPMGLSEAAFGLLLTAMAVGSIVGSVLASRIEHRIGPGRAVWAAVTFTALPLLVPVVTTNAFLIAGAFVLEGLAAVVWNVITVTLRQRIVPDALLGRVNASYRLFAWGTQPLGALAGGIIAELFGLRAVFVMGAALIGGLVVARRVVTDEAIRAAQAVPTPTGEAGAVPTA
jgi:MFS family permease